MNREIPIIEMLETLREGGCIKRFHTARTVSHQTVAAHSWGVATLLLLVAEPPPSEALLRAALFHDVPEVVTGDVPAPVKWNNPLLRAQLDEIEERFHDTFMLLPDLQQEERELLSWCDMAELVLHCLEEAQMGNRFMLSIAERGLHALRNRSAALSSSTQRVKELQTHLEKTFTKLNGGV